MTEHVHMHHALPEEPMQVIRQAVEGRASLSVEGDAPPETTILVDGRPQPFESLPSLRAVIIPWAGVPPETAQAVADREGVHLYNLHHNAPAVSELGIGLLLACARGIVGAHESLRKGDWADRHSQRGFQLAGKTAAILGYGAIGRQMEAALKGLGMETVGIGTREAQNLKEHLSRAHVLMVNAPLTPQTKGMIGAEELQALQPPRLVVNVGRGAVIQEEAFYEALKDGTVAAAGIDVWYQYPGQGDGPHYPANLPFWELDNVVLSPHVGGLTCEADTLRAYALAELLDGILERRPLTEVDPKRGY